MKRLCVLTVLIIVSAEIAAADTCDSELATLDAQIAASQLNAEQKAQLADMRSQAASLCAAGNDSEGLDVITEARAMLEQK
jgi:hypothetical protein